MRVSRDPEKYFMNRAITVSINRVQWLQCLIVYFIFLIGVFLRQRMSQKMVCDHDVRSSV
ncbi:hypothetical protein CLU79DRAFT_779546 [Phycomyces nitens]|nr:hypothetical protein CLU79DRAFT_779546 [Phycomyces nitens]